MQRRCSCLQLQRCGAASPSPWSWSMSAVSGAPPPLETSLADDIISQHGKVMDPSPFCCPRFWWSGEQVAEGRGGRWRSAGRTTAKNTHSALSTSGRCTQGPHAAQTEIKSTEDSRSCVCVCVCSCTIIRYIRLSHYTSIYYTVKSPHESHYTSSLDVESNPSARHPSPPPDCDSHPVLIEPLACEPAPDKESHTGKSSEEEEGKRRGGEQRDGECVKLSETEQKKKKKSLCTSNGLISL